MTGWDIINCWNLMSEGQRGRDIRDVEERELADIEAGLEV